MLAMSALRIFCDAPLSDSALQLLRQGVAPHELVFPRHASESVLARTEPDPALRTADSGIWPTRHCQRHGIGTTALGSADQCGLHALRYTATFDPGSEARGVIVTNSSGVFAEACAEHLFAFMLAQARLLPQALAIRAETGSREWTDLREGCALLQDQSAIILGFGAIAERLLQLLSPFGDEGDCHAPNATRK